jgi:hypothetical protein
LLFHWNAVSLERQVCPASASITRTAPGLANSPGFW